MQEGVKAWEPCSTILYAFLSLALHRGQCFASLCCRFLRGRINADIGQMTDWPADHALLVKRYPNLHTVHCIYRNIMDTGRDFNGQNLHNRFHEVESEPRGARMIAASG